MQIRTGRVQDIQSIRHNFRGKAVDVTVKSGIRAFAPTWGMVTFWKTAGETLTDAAEKLKVWEEYTRQYHLLMLGSKSKYHATWDDLLLDVKDDESLILCCYCQDPEFCHRTLLASLVKSWADQSLISATIIGEVNMLRRRT